MDIDELVVKNAGWIRRKAHDFYSDSNEADDLASETIFRCLNNAHKFNSRMSFKPWANTIMTNIYITQYNRRKCVMFTSLDYCHPCRESDRSDQLAAVNRILTVIENCSRKSICIECVTLYAEGYNHAEIAERLGIPIGTVKSRISSGRKMLREALS